MLNRVKLLLKYRLSLVTLILVSLFTFTQFAKNKSWAGRDVFMWDVASYYWYLPAFFVHHDPALHFTDGKEAYYNNGHKYFAERAENGAKVNRYMMGTALMYSPFFLATLAYDKIRGAEINEFSTDYEFMICLSALVYAILGLILIRQVLLRWFSDPVVALAIILLPMATNLLHYVTNEGPMSHAFSFFLFSAFVWLTINWHESGKRKHAVLTGLVLGLIFLVRPTNVVVGLFFLLYGVTSFREFIEKIKRFFTTDLRSTLWIALTAFLTVSIQFIYWKSLTGHWMFYGYGRERFFFDNPHILEGLLSYRKGWLVYTPVMFFSIAGFFLLRKYDAFKWAVPVFFAVNCYIVFSWWSWWYAGGFGQRALIESYPIMILPLCAFLQWIIDQKKKWLTGSILVSLAFLIHLNLVQTRQYKISLIHWDSMTKEAYWAAFLSPGFPENYGSLLKAPDNEKALSGEDEYEFDPF